MNPVYVLGVEHPRGVACVRSLSRYGAKVIAVDCRLSSSGMPYTSRYVDKRLNLDPDAVDAVETLEQFANQDGGVIIPTNDEYVIFVAKNHQRLARSFNFCSPSWQQLKPAMDRSKVNQLAQEAGLNIAVVYEPNDIISLNETLENLDFNKNRYVLKLQLWTDSLAETRLQRKTTYGGTSVEQLRERVLEIADRTGEFPVIQELVPGETNMSIGATLVMDQNSRPVLSYCVRRLKLQTYSEVDDFIHPYDLGGNVFCETVHDPEAIEMATRLAKALIWVGVITVEFRRDMRDGTLTFVKIDPRVIRSITLSTKLGMDVPNAIYEIANGFDMQSKQKDYPDGVCWLWIDNYFGSLWRNRKRTSVRKELIGMIRHWKNIKAFAYWDTRDPFLFISQIILRLTWARRWVRPKKFTELTGIWVGPKRKTAR